MWDELEKGNVDNEQDHLKEKDSMGSNFDAMKQWHNPAGSAHHFAITITNVDCVPGKTIVEHYGLVSGNVVRSRNIGANFMASMKNIVGGELVQYTELLVSTREQAIERMIDQARSLGANAVVNVRFSTSSVDRGANELYVYGTAVKVQ
jgi:uncharacterized protein YbjQ (UPF0145 family)